MEYIPIITSHRYRLEVYVKNTATSGSTYPSFYPYDIDKKFIYNYQCKDGFNLLELNNTAGHELACGINADTIENMKQFADDLKSKKIYELGYKE